MCVYTVYIYLSWEAIASFFQLRCSVQEEGLSCSGRINSSISSTNSFFRLSPFPSSPSPFPSRPSRLFGDAFLIFLFLFYNYFFSFFFPFFCEGGTDTHTQTQRNKGKKSTWTYPAAANPETADEEGGWLLPQGKALPLLPPRHLLREKKERERRGQSGEKQVFCSWHLEYREPGSEGWLWLPELAAGQLSSSGFSAALAAEPGLLCLHLVSTLFKGACTISTLQ